MNLSGTVGGEKISGSLDQRISVDEPRPSAIADAIRTVSASKCEIPNVKGFPSDDNVRDNRAAGDVEFVGADTIAKLSAETSLDRAPAASCSSHCYPARAILSRRVNCVSIDCFGHSLLSWEVKLIGKAGGVKHWQYEDSENNRHCSRKPRESV